MAATKDLGVLLGPEGPLARGMPRYESREGQVTMALRIQDAIERGRVLLCEAGTGTGKTLAYLVPAILSGKKVIVSTASRALQDQIVHKDLPLLRQHLGLAPRVSVMKGLSNYLCLRRSAEWLDRSAHDLGRSTEQGAAWDMEEDAETRLQLATWKERTLTGDFAELEQFEENSRLLTQISSGTDTRLGAPCPYFNACFVTKMKREAEAAQLVIVNHHLFFADLALRGPHPARVLPNYEVVIFDEAHRLEDTAVTFFGSQLSTTRIQALVGELERTLAAGGHAPLPGTNEERASPPSIVRHCSTAFFDTLRQLRPVGGEGSRDLDPELWTGPLRERYFALDDALAGLAAYCEGMLDRPPSPTSGRIGASYFQRLELCLNRCRALGAELTSIAEGARGNVCWFAETKRSATVGLSPVELGDVLRERLFEAVPCVILTSATLTGWGPAAAPPELPLSTPEIVGEQADFSFIRGRLGLGDGHLEVDNLFVPSPFDFEHNALLYTPSDLPAPDTAHWGQELTSRILELLEPCDGGALVLTTSLRSMRQLERLLRESGLQRPLWMQGAAPKQVLLDRFREAMNGVLVATSSFWEGVDIPGRALRMVILDKIPFAVPSDPLVKARCEALEQAGGNPFMDLHLPLAQITLKQGFGRLIRQREDWGVVALLDSRVHKRGYGRRLLRGLPPATVTDSLERTLSFLRERSTERAG